MEVTSKSLLERYDAMNTEALADLYDAGGMTDLAVSVLKDVITSRGLDWTEFITRLPTEPESLSDWELWKSESKKAADEYRLESKHKANGLENHAVSKYLQIVSFALIIGGIAVALMTDSIWAWGVFGGGIALLYSTSGNGEEGRKDGTDETRDESQHEAIAIEEKEKLRATDEARDKSDHETISIADKEKVRAFVGRSSNVLVPLVITLAGVAGMVAALYNDFTAGVIAVFLLCVGIVLFFLSSRKKLVLVITLSLLVLLLVVPVALFFVKPWTTPEVLTGDSVSDDVLEHLRTQNILEPTEKLVAYYDNTIYDDGTEASILTTRRIIYYCDNEICRSDGRFGDRNLRRTTAIALGDVTDIEHRIGTMIDDGFPGDIIEIQSAQGEQLTILIDMWHDGPSFLDLFLVERARESREK